MSKTTAKKFYEQPSTFRVVFEIADDRYAVVPVTVHPEVAFKAFRMLKTTGAARINYDVIQQKDGTATCECLGFLRHGHRIPCRHIRTLCACGMFNPLPPTKPAKPAPVSPAKEEEPAEAAPLFAEVIEPVPMALPA
jgi:hypothetical protein